MIRTDRLRHARVSRPPAVGAQKAHDRAQWAWRPQEVDLPGAPGPPEVGELDDPRQPPENMLQSQSKWFPCPEAARQDAPRETTGAAVTGGWANRGRTMRARSV